jgi:RNA polymerase sigma-70 factor (ECF subfamily)
MSGRADLPGTVEALLVRVRSGDPAALPELFRTIRPLLGTWAAHELRGTPAGLSRPSDIAQDTTFKALTGFASFRGKTEAELHAWLRKILQTCIAQSRRAARQQKRDERRTVSLDSEVARESSGQPSPSEVTATGEHWQQILTCIFELPSEQKEAIWLVYLKRVPIAEVAKTMGKSEAAIGGLLHRGIEAIRVGVAGIKPEASPNAVHRGAAAALVDYLKRCEHEGEIDVESFVAEHPGCAGELREAIDWTLRLRALRPTSALG